MLLNLGCGRFHAPGWLNVDVWPGAQPDLLADLTDLPLPDGCAQRVYAGHVLEHIPPAAVPLVLAEIRRVLAPGGLLCAVGPDLDRIDRTIHPGLHRDAEHGGGEGRTDPHIEHRWACTEARLLAAVAGVFPDARAVPIAEVADGWPVVSRVWWQCAAEGSRR